MKTSFYKKPARTHNGFMKTDLPLTIVPKASRQKMMDMATPGQLLCVGKVYVRTHDGAIRIR
jgi:hypothetical protein